MRGAFLFFYLAIGWVLLAPLALLAAPRDAVPLRIVSKSSDGLLADSVLDPPPATYTLSLRNESNKTITAWRLSCLYSENDGNFAVASVEEDSFFRYEGGIPADVHGHGPIEPGDVRGIAVPKGEIATSAPFSATSCGVDAVVFADCSQSGVPSVVDRIFDDRARIATEALAAVNVLNRILEGRGFAQDVPLGGNRYAEAVREADRSARSGDAARVLELRTHLRDQVDVVEKHLPRRWRLRHAELTPGKELDR